MRMAALLPLVALGLVAPVAAAPPRCDRTCLAAGLDSYLGALTHHAPDRVALAPDYRATENGVEVARGDGLWRAATALGAMQRRYFDPQTGQAAYYGLIDEAGTPAVAVLRLRFHGRQVIESEAVVTRKGDRLYDPAGVIASPPAQASAAGTPKMSRAALLALAANYLDAMQRHSGTDVPHTADCVRLEGGAGGTPLPTGERHGCTEGFERLTQIAAVGHRRLALVDQASSAVVGTYIFLRPPGAVMPNGQPWKRNLVMTVFTTRNATISGVYSAVRYLEPEQPEASGWPDQGN